MKSFGYIENALATNAKIFILETLDLKERIEVPQLQKHQILIAGALKACLHKRYINYKKIIIL